MSDNESDATSGKDERYWSSSIKGGSTFTTNQDLRPVSGLIGAMLADISPFLLLTSELYHLSFSVYTNNHHRLYTFCPPIPIIVVFLPKIRVTCPTAS